MYCQKCGSENDADNKFCSKCGTEFKHSDTILTTPSKNESENKTPVALIATSWILFALCFVDDFLDFGVAIIIDIGAILCAILLLVNKNKTAKVNGIIILSIWAICFIISILVI
jgi:uncharacterized membrane protein YvbJ